MVFLFRKVFLAKTLVIGNLLRGRQRSHEEKYDRFEQLEEDG